MWSDTNRSTQVKIRCLPVGRLDLSTGLMYIERVSSLLWFSLSLSLSPSLQSMIHIHPTHLRSTLPENLFWILISCQTSITCSLRLLGLTLPIVNLLCPALHLVKYTIDKAQGITKDGEWDKERNSRRVWFSRNWPRVVRFLSLMVFYSKLTSASSLYTSPICRIYFKS